MVCREDLLALEGCEVVFALRWDLENCLLKYILWNTFDVLCWLYPSCLIVDIYNAGNE